MTRTVRLSALESFRRAVQYDAQRLSPAEATRMQAFVTALRDLPGTSKKIETEQLWRMFLTAFPHLSQGKDQQHWYAQSLCAAEAEGALTLPRSDHLWSRHTMPPLPHYALRSLVPRPEVQCPWRDDVWHPQLEWVKEQTTLSEEEYTLLRRINKGLAEHEFDEPAPVKCRSLDLTGKEKRLEQLVDGRLFREGRLTLDMLGCVAQYPPLNFVSVGPAARALVFENCALYWVAQTVLKDAAVSPYGIVAYGGGAAFIRSVQHLLKAGRTFEAIHYLGDLDRHGLDIVRRAGQTAKDLALPPLEPALGLYEKLWEVAVRRGKPNGFPCDLKEDTPRLSVSDKTLTDWLPLDLRAQTIQMFRSGNRIAEETLKAQDLRDVWQIAPLPTATQT